MAEEVVNGGFETGDLTGWTGVNASAGSQYAAQEGTWYGVLHDSAEADGGQVWQSIDLTNVSVLSYYAREEMGNTKDVPVYFDDVLVHTGVNGLQSWVYNEFDVSSYTGVVKVEFRTALANADLEIDVVSAISAISVQINIGDTWKAMSAMKINIGDVWKPVVGIQQNIGDVWKTVL